MNTEYQELRWEQQNDQLIVDTEFGNEKMIRFKIDSRIINYLVSNTPRIYYISIEQAGKSDETVHILNLENLKPVAVTGNSLKIRFSKSTDNSSQNEMTGKNGKYFIARGESYHERYLSEKGWQHLRHYFELIDFSTIQPAAEVVKAIHKVEPESEKPVEKKVDVKIAQNKNVSKLKECISCHEIIPTSAQVCPYCKANQSKIDAEEDVDISI